MSDTGLVVLAEGCSRLEVVGVDCCDISDHAIVRLAEQSPLLRVLQASGCAGVGDASVIALAHSCPQLERADLRGCANVTESAVMEIEKCLPACKLLVNGLLRNIW